MRNDPLIKDLMTEIRAYIECEKDVDLLDPKTWSDTPYKKEFARAEELIWNAIAPRAAHQQRVENLVQTAGHLGKTHVGEARRSARAKIHSLFYRDFKTWALDHERKIDEEIAAKNKNKPDFVPKKKRAKVEGKRLFKLKAHYTTRILDKMDLAIKSLEDSNPGIMTTIATELSKENKSSHIANEAKYKKYEEASNAERDRILSSKNLADVTSWMNGSVILSYLSQKAGAREYILAELEYRGVKYYLDPETNVADLKGKDLERHQHGERSGKWDNQTIAVIKKALKVAEYNRLCEEARKANIQGPKLGDVKEIEPLSDEMKEWMPIQWRIYKERNGQVEETAGG
jgi:hypothetical protein